MSSPASSVFALIIGIDSYKSGSIWNLHYCVDDAERMEHWLCEDLDVPKDHIRTLVDSQASKENIERTFMEHLVNNPSIQHGDPIIVYFAGHGTHVSAPKDWYRGMRKHRSVEVLCTYDYDTRDAHGRVSGICDRSMHAMLNDLAEAKGDNITFIMDTCFSPSETPENIRERSRTRWTPTGKTTSDDLYRGLWPGARANPQGSRFGFLEPCPTNYIILAACSPGHIAVEGRDGGHFTAALLHAAEAVALHRTSYTQLFEYINRTAIEEAQKAVCLGKHKNRIVFDDVPFVVDGRFLAVALCTKREVRVEAGTVHGVIEGCELSLHSHNYRRSRNPILATVAVVEAHPTWCLAQIRTQDLKLPKSCWGRITRWNNQTPFRVKLKASIASVMTIWRLKKELPHYALRTLRGSGVTTQGVEKSSEADISIKVQRRSIIVERHDTVGVHGPRVINFQETDAVKVINEAASFSLHLQSNNPSKPLEKVIRTEIHDVDGHTLSKVGPNLLALGKAMIHPDHRSNLLFNMVIRNGSKLSLWPYILAMDTDNYKISLIYQPPHAALVESDDTDTDNLDHFLSLSAPSPLRGHGVLDIMLTWPDHPHPRRPRRGHWSKAGYVKVLLSSTPIGSLALFDDVMHLYAKPRVRLPSPNASKQSGVPYTPSMKGPHYGDKLIWDSFLYPVAFEVVST